MLSHIVSEGRRKKNLENLSDWVYFSICWNYRNVGSYNRSDAEFISYRCSRISTHLIFPWVPLIKLKLHQYEFATLHYVGIFTHILRYIKTTRCATHVCDPCSQLTLFKRKMCHVMNTLMNKLESEFAWIDKRKRHNIKWK